MSASKRAMFDEMEKHCPECGDDLTTREYAARFAFENMCFECYEKNFDDDRAKAIRRSWRVE